ncbi:hypothetical protein GGI07_004576 [Coemansia sp. Benny D115]|nr:hypothetical protein GGI07_004576 [Coemansia sp. Benny D115]
MPRIKAAAKPSTRGAGGKGRGRTAQLKDDSPTAPPENTADEPVIPDSIPRKRGRKPKDSTAEALDKAAIAKPTAASARGRAKKVVTPVDDEPPAKKMRKAKDSIADSMAPEAPKKTTTAKRTATASRGRAKKVVTPVEDKPPAKRGRKAKDPVPDNVVPEAPTEAVIAQPAVVASRGRAKKAVLPVDVEAPAKRGRKAKDPVAASAVPEAPTEAVIAQPTVVASRGRARKALVPAEVEAPAKRGRKPKNPAVDITTPKALSKTATVKPTTATTRGRAKKVVTPIDAEAPAKRGRKTKDPAADSVAVETPGKTATVKPTTTATRGRAKKAVTPVEDRPPAKRGRKAKDPVADSVAPEAPTEAVIAQPTVVASRGRARKAMLSVEDKLPAKRGRKVKDPLAVDVAAEAPTEATVARSTSATGRGRPKKIVLPVEDRPSAKRGRKAKDSTDDIVAPEAPKKTTTAESTAATSRGRPKKIVPPVEDKLPAKRGRKAKDLAADTVAPEAPIETATVKSAAAANRGRAKKVVAPVENKLPAKRGRQAKDSADDGAVPETPAEAPTAKSTLATGRGRAKKDKLSVDDEPPAKRIRKTKDSITDSSAPEAPHMSVIAQLTAAASRGRAKKGVLSVDDESTARRTRAQSRTNALDTAEPTATEMPPAEDGQASGKGRGRGKSVGRGRGRGRGQALKIVDFFSAGVSVDISVSESSDNASEAPYSDNASEILSDGIASDTTSSRGRGRGRGKSSVSARGSGRSKSRGRGRGQGRGQSLNRAESPNPIDTQDTTDTIADDVIPDQHEEQSDRLDHSDKDGEPIAETGADDDDDDDDAYYNVDHDHDGDDDDNDDGERQDIIGNGNGDDPIVLEDDDYRPLPKGYVKKGKGSRGKGRENRGAARAREGSSINKDPDSRPSRKNSKSVRQSLLPLETRAPTIIGLNMPNRSNRCNRFVCEDISTRITKSGKAWNGPIQDLHYVNNNYIDIGLDQDAWALLRAIRFKRSAVRIENDPRLLEAYLPPGCAELSSCSNADQDRDQASRLNIRQIDESMKPAEDSPPLSLRPLEILEKPNKPKSGWVANAGQSVWSIDWVPVRHESTEDMPSDVFVSDHIAVGGMTPGSNARECANVAYIERDNLNTPGIVQIWRVSTVIDAALHTSTSKDCTLDMVLLHKFGNCLALKWCPMSLAPPQPVTDTTDTGSGEDGDSVNSSHGDFLPILGLLAAVFADGYLRVCAVPQPNAIRGQPLQSDSTTRPVYMHWPEHSLVEIKPYHDRYTTLDWAGVDTIVAGSAKGLVSAWSLLACIKAQYAAACSGDAGGRDKWPYEMPIEQLVSDDEDVDQALHQAVPIVNHQMHRGIIFNIAAVCNDVGLRTQENLVRQRDDFSRLDPATILISSAGRDCRLRTFPLAFPTRTNHYLASEPGYIHAHHMYWLDFGYTHCDSLGVMRKNSEAFLVSNCTSDPWMRAALKNDTLSAHIGSAESDPAAKHFSSRWNSGSGRGSNILMNLGAPLMCICYSDFHVFAAAASCDGSLILQNIAIKGSSFKRYVSLRRVYTLLWDPVVANANNAVCADDQDDDASHPLVVPEQSERRLACLDGDSIDLQNRPPHKPLTYGYIYPPQVAVQACAWSRNPLSSTWVASAGASGLLRIENVAP